MTPAQRAAYLLGIVAQYLDSCEHEGEVFYDDAKCDTWCLAEDCKAAAEDLQACLAQPVTKGGES